MKEAQKPDHISINNMIARLGIRGTPSGGCAPRAPLGRRGFWFGQRPSSAEGPAWPAPLSRPLRPPDVCQNRGTPPVPPAGAAPPAPCLEETLLLTLARPGRLVGLPRGEEGQGRRELLTNLDSANMPRMTKPECYYVTNLSCFASQLENANSDRAFSGEPLPTRVHIATIANVSNPSRDHVRVLV